MKPVPEALAAHLRGGATTMCHCWLLTRRDGERAGFTDHDEPLAFDGAAFTPESGLEASEIASGLGLGIDNLEVTGAIASEHLSGADLEAGLWDDAGVVVWRVNWAAPEERVRVFAGSIGEVTREDGAFTAEIRGVAHRLDQERGRLFQFGCDAELGDARCGVDLGAPAFRAEGAVHAALGAGAFRASGLEGFAAGWFSGGMVTWTSGANVGARAHVRGHALVETGRLDLWAAPARPMAPGDTFTVTAGCDKQFTTCRTKFDNRLNFRGFPHMPGNDFAIRYASGG